MVVGGAQGALPQPCRQTPRGAHRRPPARLRRLRGRHSGWQLRRRFVDCVGPRHLDAARRSGRRAGQGQAPVRAERLQVARQVDPGAHQARLVVHQGARPPRQRGRNRGLSTRLDSLRINGRGSRPRRAQGRAGTSPRREAARAAQAGEGEDREADARGAAKATLLGPGLVVRGEVRRLPTAGITPSRG